jgi:hypothetical protein
MLVYWLFFNFVILFDFRYSSLVQEINSVDYYLPYFRQQLITCLLSAFVYWKFTWTSASCPSPFSSAAACQLSTFPGFVYWKFLQRSAPCSSPLPWCTQCTLPPLLHIPFQLLAYYSVFLGFLCVFLQGRGQSFQQAMLVYPRVSCGNTECRLFAHLLVCISQAGLELASGGTGALLFFQCNMAWRSFVQARGSGCQSFASSW